MPSNVQRSAPARVNDPTSYSLQTFMPQVHVADDGTVGVSYYELDDNGGTTTVHLVHCHQAAPAGSGTQDCSTVDAWNGNGQALVGGPFNITTAPNAEGYFVGEYEGLTDFGAHGFRPFFVVAQPVATKGPTDPFSIRSAQLAAANWAPAGLACRESTDRQYFPFTGEALRVSISVRPAGGRLCDGTVLGHHCRLRPVGQPGVRGRH